MQLHCNCCFVCTVARLPNTVKELSFKRFICLLLISYSLLLNPANFALMTSLYSHVAYAWICHREGGMRLD